MTMPSASPVLRPRLYVRIAWETAGVGVYSSPCAIMTSTPFAASTSSALARAGTERACVSMPRNSGPSIFCCLRYRQIAWVMARICDSLKALSNETAMSGGAEGHALCRHGGIGTIDIVGRDKSGYVRQHRVRQVFLQRDSPDLQRISCAKIKGINRPSASKGRVCLTRDFRPSPRFHTNVVNPPWPYRQMLCR